jgi:hypothetical protein
VYNYSSGDENKVPWDQVCKMWSQYTGPLQSSIHDIMVFEGGRKVIFSLTVGGTLTSRQGWLFQVGAGEVLRQKPAGPALKLSPFTQKEFLLEVFCEWAPLVFQEASAAPRKRPSSRSSPSLAIKTA